MSANNFPDIFDITFCTIQVIFPDKNGYSETDNNGYSETGLLVNQFHSRPLSENFVVIEETGLQKLKNCTLIEVRFSRYATALKSYNLNYMDEINNIWGNN